MSLTKAYLEGDKGSIKFPFRFYRPKKVIVKSGDKKEILRCPGGYIYEFDKVAEDIRAGKLMSEEIPWSDTLEVMRIMDAVRYSVGFRYPAPLEEV
jgi:xylose isomerase